MHSAEVKVAFKQSKLILKNCINFRMPTEQEQKPIDSKSQDKKPPMKPCCACPETKQPRDACIIEKGEENCPKIPRQNE